MINIPRKLSLSKTDNHNFEIYDYLTDVGCYVCIESELQRLYITDHEQQAFDMLVFSFYPR